MTNKGSSEVAIAGAPRFKDDAGFKKVAERLMAEIMRRDQEDGAKLAKGIQLAVDKKAPMGLPWGWWVPMVVVGECLPHVGWLMLGGCWVDVG
eukprot:Skav236301  [mRNA]  locus=scaffold1398:129944:130222:+ [translate_table: standard]